MLPVHSWYDWPCFQAAAGRSGCAAALCRRLFITYISRMRHSRLLACLPAVWPDCWRPGRRLRLRVEPGSHHWPGSRCQAHVAGGGPWRHAGAPAEACRGGEGPGIQHVQVRRTAAPIAWLPQFTHTRCCWAVDWRLKWCSCRCACWACAHTLPTSYVPSPPPPRSPNLLASGGGDGELCIWDVGNPMQPSLYPAMKGGTGGAAPQPEITHLAWNRKVQHILGTCTAAGTGAGGGGGGGGGNGSRGVEGAAHPGAPAPRRAQVRRGRRRGGGGGGGLKRCGWCSTL